MSRSHVDFISQFYFLIFSFNKIITFFVAAAAAAIAAAHFILLLSSLNIFICILIALLMWTRQVAAITQTHSTHNTYNQVAGDKNKSHNGTMNTYLDLPTYGYGYCYDCTIFLFANV